MSHLIIGPHLPSLLKTLCSIIYLYSMRTVRFQNLSCYYATKYVLQRIISGMWLQGAGKQNAGNWRFRVYPSYALFRANPHLTLRARQATAHVTPRRSTHPRFTSTSPILTGLYYALSTTSPLLTRLAWGVPIPGRAAVERVNS